MTDKQDERARKELGEKLKKARETANLTQLEVANKTAMTANYYAMVERGEANPSFDKLRKLFKLLNIKSV